MKLHTECEHIKAMEEGYGIKAESRGDRRDDRRWKEGEEQGRVE